MSDRMIRIRWLLMAGMVTLLATAPVSGQEAGPGCPTLGCPTGYCPTHLVNIRPHAYSKYCPPPLCHCQEGPPHLKIKTGCPKPICDPCNLPHFGYFQPCWRAWPYPPDWSHCPVPPPSTAMDFPPPPLAVPESSGTMDETPEILRFPPLPPLPIPSSNGTEPPRFN
jgi:hypothetical protein